MYGYNPYMNPYQQRLAQLEQPMYQQPSIMQQNAPQSVSNIKGRVVGSLEEARASQVDFDGSVSYFVCPGEQKIYAKSIGMNGLPVFQVYELCADKTEKNLENHTFSDFDKRLSSIEAKVKELCDGHIATVTTTE